MLLNTTVIYCLANVAGYSNGDPHCSNFALVVDDIVGIQQSIEIGYRSSLFQFKLVDTG